MNSEKYSHYLILFFFLLFVSHNLIFGQTHVSPDTSLVLYKDLSFISKDEKEALGKKDKCTNLDLFYLALNAQAEPLEHFVSWYQTDFDFLIKDLESNRIRTYKPEKQVKMIYSLIHDKKLMKYKYDARFEELFTNGNYNCVTASMLYGIIYQHYNIPVEVKETISHVYLTAKAGTKSLLIETTDPTQGYISYNQAFKEKYIEYLKESKMILETDIRNQGIDSIFQDFFFTEKNISLQELAGIQYSNNAVFLIQKSDFKNALDQIQKSYYLYPAEKTKYILQIILGNLLNQATYMEEADWKYYAWITRFSGGVINNEMLKDEFSRLTQKILVDKSNVIRYQLAYNYIINNCIPDSSLKNSISGIYNTEIGRYYLVTNQGREAFPYIEEALKLNPDNYQVQTMFIASFMVYLESSKDDEEGIARVEEYYTKYESLRKDPRISSLLLGAYLFKTTRYIDNEDWIEGDVYLTKFEKMLEEENQSGSYIYQIEEMYTRIAAHYFKLNDVKKAREYINRGLKYYPDSYRLKSSLEMLK